MRDVYIIGKGQTKRGFFPERDVRSLISEAVFKALDESKMTVNEIGQTWLSHYPTTTDMQMTIGQVAIDAIGASSKFGCISIEQACTSGGQAMHDAYLGVASGIYDTALVIGIGKLQDSFDYLNSFSESGFNPFNDRLGIRLNMRGSYLAYNWKYNITQEDYAAYYELEYWYAVRNPVSMLYGEKAHTKEDYYKLPYRFYPDKVGVYSTGCDGASAMVFACKEVAKRHSDILIKIIGISHKEESSYYSHALDYGYGDAPKPFVLYHSHSLENALKEAFSMAKVKPEDLDVYQPHDCTIEICWDYIDTLGHPEIPYGYGPKFITLGAAYPDGILPMLTCGSAKAGQPRGAIALDFVIENCLQLSENAEGRQVILKNYIACSGTSPERPSVVIIRRER